MAEGTSFEGFSVGLHQGDSSSSQLIVRAQRGDAAAFQELIHSYDAMVMRAALALTGSEDPAQEIYFRVFRDAYISVNMLDSSWQSLFGCIEYWLSTALSTAGEITVCRVSAKALSKIEDPHSGRNL
jgi:hypothetical protein